MATQVALAARGPEVYVLWVLLCSGQIEQCWCALTLTDMHASLLQVVIHSMILLTGRAGAALQASATAVSADAMPRMGATLSAAAAAGDPTALQQMPAWQQRQQQQQLEPSLEAAAVGRLPLQHEAYSQRPPAASQGLYRPKRRHYGYGEKLAAAALWAAATGRGQSAQLRQCLTYSEIRLKALATAQVGSCVPGWSAGWADATTQHSCGCCCHGAFAGTAKGLFCSKCLGKPCQGPLSSGGCRMCSLAMS